jgi:hypothetical protein
MPQEVPELQQGCPEPPHAWQVPETHWLPPAQEEPQHACPRSPQERQVPFEQVVLAAQPDLQHGWLALPQIWQTSFALHTRLADEHWALPESAAQQRSSAVPHVLYHNSSAAPEAVAKARQPSGAFP